MLGRAKSATLVHVFHFPFPELGYMIPEVDGCRWQALQERIN
jgi:hypothetical protein